MNFARFISVVLACSLLVFGQVLCQFDNFPIFFNELQPSNNAARDPREDTGPVRFPQSPAGPAETSGVQVGASGFGFVPPNRARARVVGAVEGNGINEQNAGQFFQVL